MKKCLFCKNTKKLSKEHIIPKWLLNELGSTDKTLATTHFTMLGLPKSKRVHSFKSLVSGMVCENCNNKWMSRLEISIKDLVIRLINLNKKPKDVKNVFNSLAKNHEVLARWAFKTAIVLNHATNYKDLVPEAHFHSLHSSKIPEGVWINLGFANNSENITWIQDQTVLFIGKSSEIPPEREGVYKITFQFRYLLLRICCIPFKNYIQDYKTEASILLWPEFTRYEKFKIYENISEFNLSTYFVRV